MAKYSADASKPTTLSVEDAEELKGFLNNAKRVWRQGHPEKQKHRGRPSEKTKVVGTLWELFFTGEIDRRTSQGKMIKLVKGRLEQNTPPPHPHEDSVLKWVKMFRLMTGEKVTRELGESLPLAVFLKGLTPVERPWLEKHAPSTTKAIEQVLRLWERLGASGVPGKAFQFEVDPFRTGEPMKVNVTEIHHTPEEVNELLRLLAALRSETDSFYTPPTK